MKGGVRQRGDKYSYYFKYKDEYDKWKTKEKGGFETKKEANAALRKAIIDFEETGSMMNKNTYTLEEYIQYWFQNVGNIKLKYNTLLSYRNTVKNHIIPKLGHLKIDTINADILQKFFAEKQMTSSKSSVKTIKIVLSNVFKLARKQKLVKGDPLAQVEYNIKKPNKDKELITTDDVKLIESKLKGTDCHAPITIALETGMRRGEVLGLIWDDIDFEGKIINVNKQLQKEDGKLVIIDPKTPTSNRKIRMTTKLYDYLIELQKKQNKIKAIIEDEYYSEYDFICCYDDGRPIAPDSLTARIYRFAQKHDINFNYHDLRHVHATRMLEADINIKVIQERLGHSNISVTLDVYSHLTKKMEDDAIEKFEKLYG